MADSDEVEASSAVDIYPSEAQKFDQICEPDSEQGTCRWCDTDGRLQTPLSDPMCSDISCDAMDRFVMRLEGHEQVCLLRTYGIAKAACGPEGDCAKEANVHICPVLQERVVMRAVLPCSIITGCNGQTPPSVEPAPDESLCPDGQCMSGQCAVSDGSRPVRVEPTSRCAMFDGDPFCGEGIDGHIPFCEFRAKTPEFRSCADVCEGMGSFCLKAWDDDRDTCTRQEPQPCSTRELDQICRCAAPPDPLRHP